VGTLEDLKVLLPDARFVRQRVSVLIAYPAQAAGIYGRSDKHDLEDLAELDALALRDAIYAAGHLESSGHKASIVSVQDMDRSDPGCLFLELLVDAIYFTALTL